MSNQSIVEHKANMFYVEFREDYLALCLACTYKKLVKGKEKSKASPYCKSLILAISESWTNDKRGKGTDLSFYMTYPQWCESMYGMFGRNVVIDSVDELIGEGLLRREPIKYKGKDTFRYTLNHAEINKRMKDLPDCTPYNTRPQVNAFTCKRDEKSTGLQVNGMPFTNQRDTRLQVNDDPFTKGRNIESTNHPNLTSSQNTESTYPQPDRDDDDPGSSEPTHALSSQDLSQQRAETEQRINDLQQGVEQELRRKSGALSQKEEPDETTTTHSSDHSGATQRLRVGAGVGHSNAAANERDVRASQQSALLMARAPQRGAKVYTAPLFETKPARPQLTEEGKNVFEWFQTIQACKVRRTNENINAANGLAEEDGMSFENLKAAIEHWQADAWVSKNKIPIDLQTLENPAGRLTFAKAMLVIRTKPKPTNERKPALLSCAHMTDDEYNAYIRKGTQR